MNAHEPARESILIIEDEVAIAELIKSQLAESGFDPVVASDPARGLEEACRRPPSLILLDVVMPGLSGVEICRKLKGAEPTRSIPIIFLTGQGAENDVVAGLELGADDYLTKPFQERVLVARIRAVLRRCARAKKEGAADLLSLAGIELNVPRHEVRAGGETVQLTLAEFQLLRALMAAEGKVLTRQTLLRVIAPDDASIIDRNVDVHVGTLRRKLGAHGKALRTVRGVGYKFQP